MLERNIEKLLFACRWLLAPMYLGLALGLLALGVKFFQEVLHSLAGILSLAESDLVLSVLSLIDIVLVGSLIVMVMLSGYENFVSKLDSDAAQESPAWLGKLDSGTLKLKVAASIVAISSIHLLRIFMNADATPNDKILRNPHVAPRHGVVQLHLCSASHIEYCKFDGGLTVQYP
jgi:uncharacterized protein (TIGR00645 family)